MKNYQINSTFIKTTLSCLVAIFFAIGNGFSQKEGIVAETEQYVVTSEHVSYSYRRNGRKYQSTKFDHYKLAQKGTKVELGRYTKFIKFSKVEGLFEVGKDDQRGILDLKTGKMIIPAVYKRLVSNEDVIIVAKSKTETLFDFNGKKLIDATFKDVQFYSAEKVIYDKSDKNQVFYSYSGKMLASFPNTKLHEFHQKEMVLERDGKYGIYTIEGKEIVPFEYADAFFGYQYLTLGKKTDSGTKYGMFSDSDLKTLIFPFEFDYLRDIEILNNGDGSRPGFMVYDKVKNNIKILDENKIEFAQFNHFYSSSYGFEIAQTFVSLDEIDDYFAVLTTHGTYQIYLHDGQNISDEEEYDYYSTYENILPGYVFFHGSNTLVLPSKYKSSREYHFPFAIYDVAKLSDKAYSISTDYGDNIFRPYNSRPIVNENEQEISLTYELEAFKIAHLSDYDGTRIAYDILNDSLILSHTEKDKNSEAILFNYLISKVMPLIKVKPLNQPVTEIKTTHLESNLFRYTNQADEVILEDMPYRLNFNAITVGQGEGKFFSSEIYIEEENAAINLILDSKLRILKPYTGGGVEGIYIFENDTVILSRFSNYSDSSQIYSTHFKKLIYNKQFTNLTGSSYFAPNITRHGIMNYEGTNGLLSYDGKLLVPFKYEYVGVSDAEFIPRAVLEFSAKKEHCYYFTEPRVSVIGAGYGYGSEFYIPNPNVYIMTLKGGYKIYNTSTATPAVDQTFTNIELVDQNRYLVVSVEETFGIFDIQKMMLVEDVKYTSDQVYQLFDDKYNGK